MCFLTFDLTAPFPMILARGVSVLERLKLVSIWLDKRRGRVYITSRNYLPRQRQRGQNSLEFALSIGGSLAVVLVLWFTFLRVLTEFFYMTAAQFFGH